jgi:acyl-phosphate glycerol 3-phosphate acyltransferase
LTGKDIRTIGSGNIGAMNTYRALKERSGRLAAFGFFSVIIIDMIKGALSVIIAKQFHCVDFDTNLPFALAAFFVVLGHNYSIFMKFTGGRGAACLMGISLYLNPLSFFVWGLPLVFCASLAQIILEKKNMVEKINWKKITDLFMMIGGKQMLGRLIGLILGPIFLYFYNVQVFLPIASGTTLLLLKNISRFEEYVKSLKQN